MPEVYTSDNKRYFTYEACMGNRSKSAVFTEEEIIEIRTRYINEKAKTIYEDYKDRIEYQTLQQIL